MNEFYKLRNKVRHYDWGSPVDIPRLLGIVPDGAPWAELWIGSHSGFSSIAVLDSGETSLEDLIARDPRHYGTLPFLFKLLAAEKPLSIQAHPNSEQAREGFERENHAGLPLDSPMRNYKDPNDKPEIICALSPFTGLCGFRGVDEINRLLTTFLEPAPAALRASIARCRGHGLCEVSLETAAALRDFLTGLFNLSTAARQALTEYILFHCEHGYELELMRSLARLYPGDPMVIAPLYLNVFRLKPGEAVFMKAGILHTYIHGFGVELMANSDNVLRGGLTGKHIDVPELMKILDFKPFIPRLITPNTNCFSYPAPCEEFSLTRICGSTEPCPLVLNGPAILIVTEGELVIANSDSEMVVKRGESIFIPPTKNDNPLSLRGNFTLFIASTRAIGNSNAIRCAAVPLCEDFSTVSKDPA